MTGKFSGTVQLDGSMGHGTSVGADGMVLVDLIEPGHEPLSHPGQIVQEQVFKEFLPHVVIRIAR